MEVKTITILLCSGLWLMTWGLTSLEGSDPDGSAIRANEAGRTTRDRETIAILGDDRPHGGPALSNPLADRLRQAGFDVTVLDSHQAIDRDVLCSKKFFLYVVPHCSTYPAAGFEALAAFIEQRGHVLFLGGPLLDDPIWWRQDRWFNRHDAQQAKRNVRAEHHPLPITPQSAAHWTRTSNRPHRPGAWQVVADGPDGEACFRFFCENLTGWDGYLSAATQRLFGPGHDLLTFLARGGPRTDRLVIEIQELDGSRWMAVIPLTTEWQRISLVPSDFQYWSDSPTRDDRGGPEDRLQPDQARRVNFQLAQSHAPALPQGEHQFWIADIGTCVNPVCDLPLAEALPDRSLETIYPRYKLYPLGSADDPAWPSADEVGSRFRATINHLADALPENDSRPISVLDQHAGGMMLQAMHCAIPRTMGRGMDRNHPWRYIPLLDAVDADGIRRGSPAWLVLQHANSRAGSVLAGLGMHDPDVLTSATFHDLVCTISSRLGEGGFLKEAGTQHFAYWPDEPLQIGATMVNVATRPIELSLRVVIRDQANHPVYTTTVAPFEVSAGQEHAWRETWNPPSSQPAVYTITTELLHCDRIVDRIVHDVAVLDTQPTDPDRFMRVSGNDFVVNGDRWYPVGINFWPRYVSGMDQDDFWAGWLRSAFYEPELVEEDLLRMKSLGINMVSIQANDPKYYRNLLDFTRRCARHEIYVNLFCGLASPLAFREEALRQFIETAQLANNPTIMAYDTIWEPGNYVFQGDRRSGWDSAWRAWVIEQYGSMEAAEADWQFTGRRDEQQRLISPPDQHFREDGPWRVMMAAYRRFMDDATSRRWNQAHRKLREIDPHHLISFRQGNTLPHDFVFTGTPKHIDFICPEGYAIPHSEAGYFAAGFITKYVHYTTGGKPVVWSEFGQSVWDPQTMSPSPARIDEVADYHELFYRMTLESGANGTVPWWWPGGYRVGEQSDYGIVHPDGTPRPAAELITRYGPRLRQPRTWPKPTVWFTMDRDAHAGGYWHVCFNTGAEAYRQAVEAGQHLGIRSAATGGNSANVPHVAIGNRPHTGQNPPKYLNAEFNWLQVRDASGQWVEATQDATIDVTPGEAVVARLSVGNTQETLWLAPDSHLAPTGTVVLRSTDASQVNGQWPLPSDTPSLTDADFQQITLATAIAQNTRVELRMAVVGFGSFGEKRAWTLRVK